MIAANTNASTDVESTSSPSNEPPSSLYNDEPPYPVLSSYKTVCPGGIKRDENKDNLDGKVGALANDQEVGGPPEPSAMQSLFFD